MMLKYHDPDNVTINTHIYICITIIVSFVIILVIMQQNAQRKH